MAQFNNADFNPEADAPYKGPLGGSGRWMGGEVFLAGDPGGTSPRQGSGEAPGRDSLFGSLLRNSLTPDALGKLLPTLLNNPEFRKSMAELMKDPEIRASMVSAFTELMKKDEFRGMMSSMFMDMMKDKQFQSTLFEMMQSPEFRAAAKPLLVELANDPQVKRALKGAALEMMNDPQFRDSLKSAALEMLGNGQLMQQVMASLRDPRVMRQILSALPMLLSQMGGGSGFPNFGQGGMPPYFNPRNNMGPWGNMPPFPTNRFMPFMAPPISNPYQTPFGYGPPFNLRRPNPMNFQNWAFLNQLPSGGFTYIPPWSSEESG